MGRDRDDAPSIFVLASIAAMLILLAVVIEMSTFVECRRHAFSVLYCLWH